MIGDAGSTQPGDNVLTVHQRTRRDAELVLPRAKRAPVSFASPRISPKPTSPPTTSPESARCVDTAWVLMMSHTTSPQFLADRPRPMGEARCIYVVDSGER